MFTISQFFLHNFVSFDEALSAVTPSSGQSLIESLIRVALFDITRMKLETNICTVIICNVTERIQNYNMNTTQKITTEGTRLRPNVHQTFDM